MNYFIAFREIQRSDLDIDCPHLPESNEYPVRLDAIIEDISNIDGIRIRFAEQAGVIIASSDLPIQSLKDALKPLLQHYWSYLRLASIQATT